MSSRVNLLAPEVRANPYPVFAELRRHAPVSQVDPMGLGHGIHFCLGAQLAWLEAGDAPARWNASLVVRGPTALPLVAQRI